MSAPLLDTHAWVWWVDRDRRLGKARQEALDRLPAGNRPVLSAISLWEVACLVEVGRLGFSVSLDEWLAAAADPRTVRVVPINPAIAAATSRLPKSFHRDPADRLIVATALVERLQLVTDDGPIRKARLVRLWKP